MRAQEITRQLPPDSPLHYDVLKRLTSTTAASGRFVDAERYLQQAVQWRELNIGPKDRKLADDLSLLINLNMRTKEFAQALATARRVQAMHIETYTAESIPVADDLFRIGHIYLAQGKPHDAARSLAAATELRTRLAGELDPGLLPALDAIIEAFKAIGGGAGTEPVYRQALAIRETVYGSDSPELISTVGGLADVYSGETMFVAAEPLYLRLLALWQHFVGKDHPMVAVTLDKLVVCYTKEGQPQKARAALAQSVAIRANFLAVGLAQQAADAVSDHRPDRAKAFYYRALAALGSPALDNQQLATKIKEALTRLQISDSSAKRF